MRRLLPKLAALVLIGLGAAPAAAQSGPVYCNIVEIQTEQLSNGVRITITGDGQLSWSVDWDRLGREGAFRMEQRPWGEHWEMTERFTHLPLLLWNARSSLGSGFVPVEKYPVSHIGLSIPEWARDGVGLEVDIVSYVSAFTGEGELRRWRYNFDTSRTEDRSSIVVTWTSDRFPSPPAPRTPVDLPSELTVSGERGRLTIRAVNVKVQEVARAISLAGGFPVVAPADDDLRVSLCLDGITAEAALQAVGIGCGLCTCPGPDGGWIIAEPRAGASGYATSAMKVIHLDHLRAIDALDLLPSFLLDYLRVDTQANALIASGPEWMLDRVAQDAAALDRAAPEVIVEVAAVEYTSAHSLSRDLRLGGWLSDLGVAMATLTGDLEILWLRGGARPWEVILDALDVQSTGQLRSRARLRVASGHVARLFVGQQRYIIVEKVEEGMTADVQPTDVGTTLEMQPWLGNGDEVALRLEFSVRSLRGSDPETGLPIIASRRAGASVRVREGETIAIAGLQLAEETRQDRAIPGLASLPLVGEAFRGVDRTRLQSELALFVTPRIVRPSPPDEGVSPDA